MPKDFILKIQEKVIALLRSNEKNTKTPLSLLVKDTCSEVSRLVACWIISADPKAETMIAKGKDVLGRRNVCHDVLLVVKDNVVSIIDPTIWQIYPKKKSIYVGKTHSVDTALEVLNKKNYKKVFFSFKSGIGKLIYYNFFNRSKLPLISASFLAFVQCFS